MKAFRTDCLGSPFEAMDPKRFTFRNRDGKLYLSVDIRPFYKESRRQEFEAWLLSKCDKYSFKPYLTSGGAGKFTYRINGDLYADL